MATDWTRSLSIEISWSFVTSSNFKFDISLFMGEICASSSLVFFSFFFRSFLLPLYNFTYWPSPMSVGDFSTVVASYVYISLWNSLMTWSFIWHLWQVCESVCSLWFIVLYALSKNKKNKNSFVIHTNVSNHCVLNFFCYSSHFMVFCYLYNLSLNFCFILYDFVTFVWGRCIVVRSGSIWIVMFIGHIYHICKCARGACFRDPGPAGKSDPGGL